MLYSYIHMCVHIYYMYEHNISCVYIYNVVFLNIFNTMNPFMYYTVEILFKTLSYTTLVYSQNKGCHLCILNCI